MWIWALLAGCGWFEEPADPGLTVEQIVPYIGKDCPDRPGWAADLRAALDAASLPVDEKHVCAVVAIIEQESTYEADPAVPGLGRIAREEIEAELKVLGPLADNGVDWLLKPVPEGHERSLAEQLSVVRTEKELDQFFRTLTAHYTRPAEKVPLAPELLAARFEKLNPVKTAGSMQVSVEWARQAARGAGIPKRSVRDLLYTRAGGLRWGTARLFAHEASYDDLRYRFADFNAGFYASRNAEFQAQLAKLMDRSLAPDGDLLVYKKSGRTVDGETMAALLAWRETHAPDLTERQLRRDVSREKERRFEDTETWRRVRASYRELTGEEPGYARVPEATLVSPKMSKTRTTAWFAKNVKYRYDACVERDG